MPEKLYNKVGYSTKFLRYKIPFPLLAYPMYLVRDCIYLHLKRNVDTTSLKFYTSVMQMKRSPGKSGSHFNPYSDLFQPHERKYVVTSTLCWTVMAALLLYLCTAFGSLQMFKIYGAPYLVSHTNLYLICFFFIN